MIRLRYAFKLARTKLHSKRGVLLASIVVASLLFAALIACVIVFTGAEKSASDFIKKANNNRYLVKVNPVVPGDKLYFSSELTLDEVHEIKAYEKQYYADLRDKYKKLNLTYDESSEVSALTPVAWKSSSLPEEQRVMANMQSPVITSMLDMKYADYAKTATNKFSDLQSLGKRYNASGYYIQKPSGLPIIPNLSFMKNNKEDFGDVEMKAGDMSLYGYFTNAIHNGFYGFEDDALLNRYLLTNDMSNLKGIPVIVSAQEAASLFGKEYDIGEEPADEAMKTEWLKNIQAKLNGHTYQVCYRNTAERTLLEKIQRDHVEAKSNQSNENYRKPSLTYDYPSTACGSIVTKEDSRTVAEKKIDADLETTQKKLGEYIEPAHEILTFQIVGIANAQPYVAFDSSIQNYVKSLITVENSMSSAIIPLHAYSSLPENMKFDKLIEKNNAAKGALTDSFATRILEFASINDARAFMDNETCPGSSTDCEKKFTADPYGSNYLILDEISKLFAKIFSLAFPIMLGLATVIIWFTVSRIMAENRKETSVYRAMGAKRRDIAAIYLVYILLVTASIAIISLLFGLAIAYVVDYIYGRELTNIAASSFGTITNDLRFNLFELSSPLLWGVVALIFFIGIVASIQPLIRNVLRPPINDIRND